jgi:hypothetical protein
MGHPGGHREKQYCGRASVERTLEGDEHAVATARPDPSLHLDCGDGLELPPLVRMLVEDLLRAYPATRDRGRCRLSA